MAKPKKFSKWTPEQKAAMDARFASQPSPRKPHSIVMCLDKRTGAAVETRFWNRYFRHQDAAAALAEASRLAAGSPGSRFGVYSFVADIQVAKEETPDAAE